MRVFRFCYNSDANDTTGGADQTVDNTTDTTTSTDSTAADATTTSNDNAAAVDKIDIPLSKMKEYGFDSFAQMDEFFAKQKELNKPDEEKQKAIEIENANFRAFAIKEGDLKEEDFTTHAAYTKAVDKELVFEKSFLPEFKAENPDITDEAELLEAAKEEFDAEYKTASAKRIAKEAKEIRGEVDTKINTAKQNYEYSKKWEGGKDAWGKFVAKTIDEILPGEEMIVLETKDGEEEIKIAAKLTKEEKAELFKKVVTTKVYAKFIDGKEDEAKAIIQERMQGASTQKIHKDAVRLAFEKGIEVGQKKSPAVGARNPFPLADKRTNTSGVPDKTLDEEIRESHNKAAQRFK